MEDDYFGARTLVDDMDFEDSFSQEIGTNYRPLGEQVPVVGHGYVANTPLVISSDTCKENSEVGSRSESCSHDTLLNNVVNELKELSNKVSEMDSTNTKMIDIMIGLVKLQIKTPMTDKQTFPTKTTTMGQCGAQFDTVEPLDNAANISNNFRTHRVGKEPFLNDISTVIISYDDDKIQTDSHSNIVRPYEHEMHYNKPKNTYKGPTTLVFDTQADDTSLDAIPDNRYYSGSCSYRRSKEVDIDLTKLVSKKKLDFPTPSPCSEKKRRCDTPAPAAKGKSVLPSPGPHNRSSNKPPRNQKLRPIISTIPKILTCKFRPPNTMRLKEEQIKVVAYIFRDDADNTDEDVFSVGKVTEKRSEFIRLVPGGYVGQKIIDMTTIRVTWNQKNAVLPSLWCLPTRFAREALMGCCQEELLASYRQLYMPAFQSLKLIYIPIEDSCGHWFLMVIQFETRLIYHLDSYLVADKIDGRRQQIRKLATVISQLLLEVYNNDVAFCALPDFEKWEIVEPRGIPNCGTSENSGLWVTEWLNMQQSFNNQILGVLVNRTVRMKTALRLLTGPHNDSRHMLATKASIYWNISTKAN